ncbi:unnamed protein product [Rhizophagus irregularis]|uniref:Uncharacterized protein n=1 Tax=Rhizophagus irregularis TaxID=588596 RepID=A0A915YN01_9GLOM|nr:unnamed protein product [Rhizophagus irregularis]CAB5188251.1 unnamed protein product [Rhizophagus irregularis]CAB5290490.1 unnamed protein product [Rhizophagus irregularis]
MASYNEIVLEISEAVKIIDFREEFMKQNATKLLFPTYWKKLGAYIVPNGAGGTNILGPDASIVLIQRWNHYKVILPTLPPENPNFHGSLQILW